MIEAEQLRLKTWRESKAARVESVVDFDDIHHDDKRGLDVTHTW